MEIKFNKEYIIALCYVLIMFILIGAATGIGWLFRMMGFPETNIVIVYLLSILLTARFTHGFVYGIIGSVVATCTFNYFFTEPFFTLSVNDPSYFVTFAIMTCTAIITSALTSKVKQSAVEAQENEAEASALYQLTNRLTDAFDLSEIAGIAAGTISDILNCRAACLCFDENGHPEPNFIQQHEDGKQIWRETDTSVIIKHHTKELNTACSIGKEFYDWPICGRETVLGVLRIPLETAAKMNEMQMRLLRSMIESTALAMDRFRSAQERIKSQEEIAKERYRSNLLRAISHDLRTPLSGIMGTAEMLMGMTAKVDERYSLAEGIHKDADWLHSLVENILNLTRLQDGKLTLEKQLEAVEEVIGGAVEHMMQRFPEHEITVTIPEALLLVPMDARLIEQVLVNLLDNAAKHTSRTDEICVTVKEDEESHYAVFSVADRGIGIVADDLPNIFQMFYTTHSRHADAQRGVGLGLAICEAIVSAHGGTIEAHNRTDGAGAEFIFTLPLEGKDDTEQK